MTNYMELQRLIEEFDNEIAFTQEFLAGLLEKYPEIGEIQEALTSSQKTRADIIAQGKALAKADYEKDPTSKKFGVYWGVQDRKKWSIANNVLDGITAFGTLLIDKSDWKSRGLLDEAITFTPAKIAKLAKEYGELTEFPFTATQTIVTTFSEKDWGKRYEDTED